MWVEGNVEKCIGCYYLRQMRASEEDQKEEPVCAFNRSPIRLTKACLVGPTDEPIPRINGTTPQPVISLDRL